MSAWADEWMDGWMDGRMDGWMDGWTDGCTDGQMDVRTDRPTDIQISLVTLFALKTSLAGLGGGEGGNYTYRVIRLWPLEVKVCWCNTG